MLLRKFMKLKER